MPFTLALALIAQTAALPEENRAALLTCGAAVRAAPDALSFEQSSVGAWFAISLAIIDSPPSQALQKRGEATSAMVDRAATMDASESAALTPQCRTRFPLAWVSNGVALPEDSFRRRALCAFATPGLRGIARVGRHDTEREWLDKLVPRFGKLIPEAEFTARNGPSGATGEGVKALVDSLSFGNLLGVVRACEAAFPA
jgi:hypothetical protein